MNKAFATKKSISILGCGWLGLPLARCLNSMEFEVKGSVSTDEKLVQLKEEGINAFKILLDPELNCDFDPHFFDSEILLINFPPKRREDIEEFHPKQFRYLLEQVGNSRIEKLIFISSTSVYSNLNRIVTEDDDQQPEKSSGRALRIVEQMVWNFPGVESCIIRFGGLIGYDRKPGRFFSSKKKSVDGTSPVNLIHLDDCIAIIEHILKKELYNQIYNACCPIHPSKKEFYEAASKIGGFSLPSFSNLKGNFKEISSEKIEKTGFVFKFQNPIDALPF